MNTRGLMELVVLNIGLEVGLLSPSVFTIMVLMSLVSTLVTSPFLECLYPDSLRNDTAPLDQEEEEEESLNSVQRPTHCVSVLCHDPNELSPYLHLLTLLCPRLPPAQLVLTVAIITSPERSCNPIHRNQEGKDGALPMAIVEIVSPMMRKSPELNFPFFEGFLDSLGARVDRKYVNLSHAQSRLLLFDEFQELFLIPLELLHTSDAVSVAHIISISPHPVGLLSTLSSLTGTRRASIRKILILIAGSSSDLVILNLVHRLSANNLYTSFKVIVTLSSANPRPMRYDLIQLIRHKVMVLKSLIHDGVLPNMKLIDLCGGSAVVGFSESLAVVGSDHQLTRGVIHKPPSYHLIISGYLPLPQHGDEAIQPSAPPHPDDEDRSAVSLSSSHHPSLELSDELCGERSHLMNLQLNHEGCVSLIIRSHVTPPHTTGAEVSTSFCR
jgi:hypothetical protein